MTIGPAMMSKFHGGEPDEPSPAWADDLDHEWTRTWREMIPSEPAEGVRIIRELLGYLAHCDWPEKDLFAVHMALEEAIMNAIKHGNGADPTKQVMIDARASAERFYICVRDEGPGFDPEELPDPRLDENLEKTTGRGVMLIRLYMTRVRYNPRGNQVELLKIRQP